MSAPQERFARKPFREEQRLLLESTCLCCGESRVLSAGDGSLQEWEENHACAARPSDSPPKATQPVLPMKEKAG